MADSLTDPKTEFGRSTSTSNLRPRSFNFSICGTPPIGYYRWDPALRRRLPPAFSPGILPTRTTAFHFGHAHTVSAIEGNCRGSVGNASSRLCWIVTMISKPTHSVSLRSASLSTTESLVVAHLQHSRLQKATCDPAGYFGHVGTLEPLSTEWAERWRAVQHRRQGVVRWATRKL